MKTLIVIAALVGILGFLAFVFSAKRTERTPEANADSRPELGAEREADSPKPEVEFRPQQGQIVRDLSTSGAISVSQQIDHYIATQDWRQAEKWAQHAIESRPDDVELRLKLAEIYCKAGMREEFAAHFERFHRVAFVSDEHVFEELIALAERVIPDHKVVQQYGAGRLG